MTISDSTLPPRLQLAIRCPLKLYEPVDPTDDELPSWLGQRMRDTTHHIHRAAIETAQDSEDAA